MANNEHHWLASEKFLNTAVCKKSVSWGVTWEWKGKNQDNDNKKKFIFFSFATILFIFSSVVITTLWSLSVYFPLSPLALPFLCTYYIIYDTIFGATALMFMYVWYCCPFMLCDRISLVITFSILNSFSLLPPHIHATYNK